MDKHHAMGHDRQLQMSAIVEDKMADKHPDKSLMLHLNKYTASAVPVPKILKPVRLVNGAIQR